MVSILKDACTVPQFDVVRRNAPVQRLVLKPDPLPRLRRRLHQRPDRVEDPPDPNVMRANRSQFVTSSVFSSTVRRKAKSSGNRSKFRLIAWLSAFVGTP